MPPSESLSDQDWDELARIVESFSAAWQASPFPPGIAEFAASVDGRLRPSLIRELIKLDLEQRWQNGLRRLLEDYEFDVSEWRSCLSPELIFEEYQLRRQAGDRVSPTELFQRFPEHADALGQLLQMDPALRSTVLNQPSAAAVPVFQPGEQLDDFDLLLQLGQGAFATVFLARQRSMQRLVALKISIDQSAEPQTLAQLDHDNIVRVYDQRRLDEPPVRLLYMQYAAGGTLADVIRMIREHPRSAWNGALYLQCIKASLDQRGESRPAESLLRQKLARMTWAELVCWIGSQLARALAYAQRHGVLHRDLKPANILLTAEGVPQLADFNISFGAQLEGTSAEADFGGSLAYMSPEQLQVFQPHHATTAGDLTSASDLYSLGVVLWELLTGNRPRGPVDKTAPVRNAVAGLMLSPAEQQAFVGTDISGLIEVLLRCLQRNPLNRFATGESLSVALELSLNQDAQRLLNDRTTRWKCLVRRWPQTSIVVTTVVPNLVMAVFNFLYNFGEIRNSFPQAEQTFLKTQSYINVVAFSVGIASLFWLIRSVTRATHGTDSCADPRLSTQLRSRCLQLGNTASAVSTTLWLVAGPVYPIALQLLEGQVPMPIFLHFVVSLSLSGLIVSAYPFFGVSMIAVRGLYPALVGAEPLTRDDGAALKRLSTSCWIQLVLAAAVPMLAVLILAVAGLNRRWVLGILAIAGFVGVALTTVVFRELQRDLQTLARVFRRDLE
ncbi:MAG: serine/threonine protein kinase [Planctomycetaceae bacterium]|nr:serine/threonine protein kinase [Planctomycetaceae bacterium]